MPSPRRLWPLLVAPAAFAIGALFGASTLVAVAAAGWQRDMRRRSLYEFGRRR